MKTYKEFCEEQRQNELNEENKQLTESVERVLNESRVGETAEYEGHHIHIECYDMNDDFDLIWGILQEGYEKLGGFKSFQSKKDLLKKAPMVKLGFCDSEIVAVDVFNDYLGGNKSVGITCVRNEKHEVGKLLVEMIIKENIHRWNDWVWSEASGAIEHYYKKFGGLPVADNYLPIYLLDKPFELVGDGFHFFHWFKGDGSQTDMSQEDLQLRRKMVFGLKDKDTYDRFIKDAYGEFIDFLKRIEEKRIDEKNVLDSYYAVKSELEQSKMIVDKFVGYVEAEFYEFPQYLYDKFREYLDYLKKERRAGRVPDGRMRLHINECIKNGEKAFKKISVLKPLEF